jgi:hypothetical protein
MKWVLRVGLTFSLMIVIGLLTLLPHVLGNKVFSDSEVNQITTIINEYK